MKATNVGMVTRSLLDRLITGSYMPAAIRMNPAVPLAADLAGVRLYRDLLVEYDSTCPIGTVFVVAEHI